MFSRHQNVFTHNIENSPFTPLFLSLTKPIKFYQDLYQLENKTESNSLPTFKQWIIVWNSIVLELNSLKFTPSLGTNSRSLSNNIHLFDVTCCEEEREGVEALRNSFVIEWTCENLKQCLECLKANPKYVGKILISFPRLIKVYSTQTFMNIQHRSRRCQVFFLCSMLLFHLDSRCNKFKSRHVEN